MHCEGEGGPGTALQGLCHPSTCGGEEALPAQSVLVTGLVINGPSYWPSASLLHFEVFNWIIVYYQRLVLLFIPQAHCASKPFSSVVPHVLLLKLTISVTSDSAHIFVYLRFLALFGFSVFFVCFFKLKGMCCSARGWWDNGLQIQVIRFIGIPIHRL